MTRKCIRPEDTADGSCQFENAVGLNCEDRSAPGGATPPGRPRPISPAPASLGGRSLLSPRPGHAVPQLQESSQSGERDSRLPGQSREGRRLTGSALAPGIWSRRRGVSGGGGAGKPRCWRGQGLRRPSVRGRARGFRRRPAGRAQTAGRGRRRAWEESSVARGDREGSRLSTGADGHGPRPFTATRGTGPPFIGLPAGEAQPQSPPGAPGSPAAQISVVSPAAAGAAGFARRPQASGLSVARSRGCVCSPGPCAFQAWFRDTLHAMVAPLLCSILGRVV